MKQHIVRNSWFSLVAALVAPSHAMAELINFSVGNSLTAQLHRLDRLEQVSMVVGGNSLDSGYHVLCNNPLTNIVASPSTTCIPPTSYGYFGEAFASTKLYSLTLQPFYGATIRQEVGAAVQLVNQMRLNPANANTRILIYGTWGANNEIDPFQKTWNRQDFTLDSPFAPSAKAYDLFLKEFQISVPTVEFIPAGHAFNAIVERMKTADQVLGFNDVTQLIGDGIHATDMGAYVATIAAYSSIYRQSPVGHDYLSVFDPPNPQQRLSPAMLNQLQQITWDVSQSFFSLKSDSQASPIARSFSKSITAIPEPSSFTCWTLILCLGTFISFRRKSDAARGPDSAHQRKSVSDSKSETEMAISFAATESSLLPTT